MGMTFEEIIISVREGSSLEHHGIQGQKWGDRNGPPYPLGSGDHSAAEKKHLSKYSFNNELKQTEKKKKKKRDSKLPEVPDYNKMTDEDREERKKKAIRDGNVKEVSSNRSHFTDQEINAVINRYDLNSKLTTYSKKDIRTAMDKLDAAMKKMDSIKNAGEKTFALYETVAKIMNTVAGTNLPTQASRNAEKQSNKQNNNNNKNQTKSLNDFSWDRDYAKYVDGKKVESVIVKDGKIRQYYNTDKDKQEQRKNNKSEEEKKKKGGK